MPLNKLLRRLFETIRPIKPDQLHSSQTNSVPRFHIDKHYDDMNRRERRSYKRWLAKNNLWDGAVVIENLKREKRLSVRN